MGAESVDGLLEVAKFWLSHENLQPSEHQGTLTRGKAKDYVTQSLRSVHRHRFDFLT